MPSNRPEDEIARLKLAIVDAKRIKDELARLVKEMDSTLSRIDLNKSKARTRRK